MSRRLDAPCEIVREDGRKGVLGGTIGDQPFYCSSQNLIAVAGISADELGPTNSVPWDHASTGRSLTGTNLTLGLWEGDGAVLTNHVECGRRAGQADHSPTNPTRRAGTPRAWRARRAQGPRFSSRSPASPVVCTPAETRR